MSTADATEFRNGARVAHPKVDNRKDPQGLQVILYPCLGFKWKLQFPPSRQSFF